MKRNNLIILTLLLVVPLSVAMGTAPAKKKKKLSLQDLILNQTPSSSQGTSVAGVRGLDETNAAADTKARDFAAIKRLEQVVVHENELKAFMDAGKLK